MACLIFFRFLLDGLVFDAVTEWIGWIFLGLGQAYLNTASKELLTQSLEDNKHLSTSGLGLMWFMGLTLQGIVIWLALSIMSTSFAYGVLHVTPGMQVFAGMAGLLLADT